MINPWNNVTQTNSGSTTSGGIGFSGLLFIVFLVLKLLHVIDWSWWWITAPLWGPLALFILIFIIAIIIAALSKN